jgi:predicted phage-related endonuclease
MSATLDGYILDEDGNEIGVLELKQVGEYIWRDWPVKFSYFGKQIDLHLSPIYYLQVMAQLAVTGLPFGIVSILIVNTGGTIEEIVQVKVERDEFIISKLEETVDSFWYNHVEKKEPPSLTITETHYVDDVDYLKSVKKEHAFASPNIEQMVTHMHALKRQMTELEEEYDRMKCYVVEYMGEAEELKNNDGIKIAFHRKQEGKRTYDHLELFKLNAALAQQIEKQGKAYYMFRLAKD